MAEEKPSLIKDEDIKEAVAEPEKPRVLSYEPIKPGDTLQSFAARHDTTIEQILKDNKVNPDYLFVGHWLYV